MIGPVFARELATIPRRLRFYVSRAGYVAALLLLMCTAWLIVAGTQNVRNLGDVARFGAALFDLIAPLQLALALVFSALVAASGVAQEKDRKTLDLLLLTNLTNAELVLGKLLASLLFVLGMLFAAIPLFALLALLGGVSHAQIGRILAVTLATIAVAGSLGSTMALWREKTFQTLALTMIGLVGWIAFWEVAASGALGERWGPWPVADWAVIFSPWRAVLAASGPLVRHVGPLNLHQWFLLAAAAGTIVLNGIAIARVRAWNPSREVRGGLKSVETADEPQGAPAEQALPATSSRPAATRNVWQNPILWREIRTWAYGRKLLLVRLGYLILFAAAAWGLATIVDAGAGRAGGARPLLPAVAQPLLPLFLVSLVLQNALAVTSITNERDGKTLDLLLVTDLTAKEILCGKLGGIFYNTKEMVLLPLLLCVFLAMRGGISGENLLFLSGGLLVLFAFASMLGIHIGMAYTNSRSAIGASLGTLLFLFAGVATCIRLMVAFAGSFQTQLAPFLAFMVGGGAGLFALLGARNPSRAIFLASLLLPPVTFYAITSFLLNTPLAVFLAMTCAYGFATAAMLVPALHEFDVASGRSAGENE